MEPWNIDLSREGRSLTLGEAVVWPSSADALGPRPGRKRSAEVLGHSHCRESASAPRDGARTVGTGHHTGRLVAAYSTKLTADPLNVPFLTGFAVFVPTVSPHVAPPI